MNRTIDGKMNLFKRSLSEHQIDLKGGEVSDLTITGEATIKSLAIAITGSSSDGLTKTAKMLQLGQGAHAGDSGSIWNSNTTEHVQCMIGGDHNESDIHDSSTPRCKLLLSGLNNEDTGSGCYHIYCEDENAKVDFYIERDGTGTVDSHVFCQNLEIPDGGSLFLGNSNDLRLTHNGTDSFIQDSGTGNLNIRTNGTHIGISDTTSSTNFMAKFVKDGAVELYHNKVKKFETTSTGITITGTIDNTSTLVTLADGWDNASSITSSQFLSNSFVRSTFLVDLGLEGVSVENNQVIGTVHGDPNYITRMTTATVGLIYKIEFICVESPAGGITNIDVSYSSTSLTKGGTTGITKVVDGGAHSPNMTFNEATGSTLGTNLTDKYLYLTSGSSGNTSAFTAGKFLIILYGYKL